jgi:SNF2 family DNA or RNA helicase
MVEQSEGRVHRKGSDRNVLIVYPICEGTVDEHISALLLGKMENLSVALEHTEATAIADTLSGLDDEDAIISGILAKTGV